MYRFKNIGIVAAIVALMISVSPAQMKCAPGKCGSIVQTQKMPKEHPKELRCDVCGMKLQMFPMTNYQAKVNGKVKHYCSIHCLAGDMRKDATPEEIKVIDAATGKYIDAATAYYVVTPGRRGTMSMVSKLAFESKKSAEMFAREHGGYVTDFKGAIKEALKDFKTK